MSRNYSQNVEIHLSSPIIDPENRDPNGLNKHFQLDFLNVIAEPDKSAYSFQSVHNVSKEIYQYTKIFIYRFLTIVVGIPLMLLWGIVFGAYIFVMIWIFAPLRRLWQSVIAEAGTYVQTISDALIAPVYRSVGQVFSNVRMALFSEQINSTKTIQV